VRVIISLELTFDRKATIARCGEIQLIDDQTEIEAEKAKKAKEDQEKRAKELKETMEKESSEVLNEIASAVQEGLKRSKENEKKGENPVKKKRKTFMSYGDPALDDLFEED
jgi:hypothetical protein